MHTEKFVAKQFQQAPLKKGTKLPSKFSKIPTPVCDFRVCLKNLPKTCQDLLSEKSESLQYHIYDRG